MRVINNTIGHLSFHSDDGQSRMTFEKPSQEKILTKAEEVAFDKVLRQHHQSGIVIVIRDGQSADDLKNSKVEVKVDKPEAKEETKPEEKVETKEETAEAPVQTEEKPVAVEANWGKPKGKNR